MVHTQFTGIAAQSFVRDSPTEKRKWEQLPKSAYESYAWGFLQTHDLPGPGPANVPEDYGMGSFQVRAKRPHGLSPWRVHLHTLLECWR